MLDALEAILDFITSVWNVCKMLITGLINFFKLLAELPGQIENYLGFFPSEIIVAIMGVVAIVIVYKIVGRD